MRSMKPTIGCFLSILSLSVGTLYSQQKTLTLDQAIQTALAQNLNVVQAQNNVESAQASSLAAHGNYLPTLSASGSWSRSQTEGPVYFQGQAIPAPAQTSNNFSTGLDLNYVIFDGFRREGSLNRATSNAVATEQTSTRTRQAIVYQTQGSYINILRNEQLVKVTEENLKRDQRQLERITESNRVGSLSLADVYRQQSQVAADELALINSQNDYDKAKADLMALIGLDVSEEYQFVDPTVSTEIPQTELDSSAEQYKRFADLSQRALSSRPDYQSATESFHASESGVTSARSGYFPTISASAGYSLSNPEFSNLSDNKRLTWGINLRWNLFDGFQTNEALQSAIVVRRNAEISLKQTERNINVEMKKALLDLDAARKGYEVSQKGLVSATEDRKIAEERYNLGAGTLLDLLTANAGLVNAQANKVNSSYNYIIAKRNVEYVLGDRTY